MWEELKRPATFIAVILLLVSIVAGILTALYFYKRSERAGRISMRVDQVQVFDKNRMGQLPLKVVRASGYVITENVYAASVSIWNSGNAEITKAAVREPFQIVLEGNIPPIDLTVTSYSSPFEVFQLMPDGMISWEHFDSGHGFKLRVVYVSEAQRKIQLKGSAINTEEMEDLQHRKEEQDKVRKIMIWLVPVTLFLSVVMVVWAFFDAIARRYNGVQARPDHIFDLSGNKFHRVYLSCSARLLVPAGAALSSILICPINPF